MVFTPYCSQKEQIRVINRLDLGHFFLQCEGSLRDSHLEKACFKGRIGPQVYVCMCECRSLKVKEEQDSPVEITGIVQ